MKTKTYSALESEVMSIQVPQETRTYKPISHSQLIDLTLNSIHSAGFELDKAEYTSARDGNIANGRYTIRNVADSEMRLEIGWQNSYDKSISLKFAIGTRIMICENGCVSGDYGAFKKKHVGEVQTFTPSAISEYIKHAGDAFSKIQKERDEMKNVQVNTRKAAELLGRMIVEENILESTQLNIIRKEMEKPTHDYGASGSLWELYQHTTFAMKEVHPSLWMNNHMKAHSFFVNEAGILVTNTQIVVPEPTPFTQLEIF